jgi:hypothetical protein
MRQNDRHANAQVVAASRKSAMTDSRGKHHGTMPTIANTAPTTAYCERRLDLISSDGEPCDDKGKLAVIGLLAAENVIKDVRVGHFE